MMTKPDASYQVGERYVLQFGEGVERVVVVEPGPDLRPLLEPAELPPLRAVRSKWSFGPRERLVQDAAGCYWCVTSRAAPVGSTTSGWSATFARFTVHGQAEVLIAESADEPASMPEAELR